MGFVAAMTELVRAVVLGIVQGITEFLPVSSDGHLTLFQAGWGMGDATLAMDVVLHVGTLGAMVWYFRWDLWRLGRGVLDKTDAGAAHRRFLLMIGAATVVTGAIGLGLKDTIESLSTSYRAAGVGFLLTSGVLLWGERRSRQQGGGACGAATAPIWHALMIGAAQGAAVWPGLSRSASTISLAVALGWAWTEAGRFSFLAAMPAIAGATLLTARDIHALPLLPSVVGAVVSFLVGWMALGLLMRFLRARRLWPFALYTFGLALYSFYKTL